MILAGKKASYTTLGCKLNFSETSTIRQKLEEAGTVTVENRAAADLCIINTCSVTDVAEHKGRQLIRQVIHRNPDAVVVVVGCYAQLRAEELLKIEGVNLVLGAKDKFRIREYLEKMETPDGREFYGCDVFKLAGFDLAYSYGDRTRSFLKIQDGCDYFCSYCTIPYARGKSRSATISEVEQAVNELVEKGIREIILTGVNTGDFGRGRNENFLELIRRLDQNTAAERFRISSIEPNLLTNGIIEAIASSARFMPHFHIPLQSGNNEVLRLMKRRYDREVFAEKVRTIREICPDAFIGVDVIAGMNGETLSYFEDSRDFIADQDVSQLHVFPYSERNGTRALEIGERVPKPEKQRRVNELLEISARKQSGFAHRFIGHSRPVLFEANNHRGKMSGFTDNYLRVEQPFDGMQINRIVSVLLSAENLQKYGD